MQLPMNKLYPTTERALTVTTPPALTQTSDRAYRVLFTRGDDLIAPPTYRSTFERQLERLLANTQSISDDYLTRAYSASMVSNACVEYRASTSAQIADALTLETVNGEPVSDGTLGYFMSVAPNVISEIVRWLMISGRFYARKRYNAGGYPTGLDVINPLDVTEVSNGGYLERYELYNGVQRESVSPQEIVTERLFDARPDGNGLSRIEAAWVAANIEQAIALHASAFFINGAAPDGFLTFDEPLTEPEYEDARTEWRANFKGAKNAHKTAVMPGKARWQSIGSVPKDLAMVELDDKVSRKICAIFEVDPILIGLQGTADPLSANSTYNTAEVAHLRRAAIPLLRMTVLPALNKQWVQKDFNRDYVLSVDESAIPALADANLGRAQTAITLTDSKIIDYKEARALTGQSEQRDGAYFIRKPDDALSAAMGGFLTLNMFHQFTLGSTPLGVNGEVVIIGGQLYPAANLLEIAVANVDKAKAPPPSPFGALPPGNSPSGPMGENSSLNLDKSGPPQNTPNIAPDPAPPTPEPQAEQRAVEPPLRAANTVLEIAALFPENTFVRYARRALSDFLTSQGINADWVDERAWKLTLARVNDAAPADVPKLIMRGAYGEGRKVDLVAGGYTLSDGVIYWNVTDTEALATLRKAAQADTGGEHAGVTGIALCAVDGAVELSAIEAAQYPLVISDVGLLANGAHEHSWTLRAASTNQQRELTNWAHVVRRKGAQHPFKLEYLEGSETADYVRDALEHGLEPDAVFEYAGALLRGEKKSEFATPEEYLAYWGDYDALMGEIGEAWLNDYMERAWAKVNKDGEVSPDEVRDALAELEDDLLEQWVGTNDDPGSLARVIFAGMAAGDVALQNDRSIDPSKPPTRALNVSWDIKSKEAFAFVKRYVFDLIRGLNDTTLRDVRDALYQWIDSGEPLDALTRQLERTFKDANRARLIAQTESTRAYNEGAKSRWEATGVKRAKFQSVRDKHVCPICAPLHNEVADMNTGWRGAKGRTSVPPMHPGCRCFMRPVIDDTEAPPSPFAVDFDQMLSHGQEQYAETRRRVIEQDSPKIQQLREQRSAIMDRRFDLKMQLEDMLERMNDKEISSARWHELNAEVTRLTDELELATTEKERILQDIFKEQERSAIQAIRTPGNPRLTAQYPAQSGGAFARPRDRRNTEDAINWLNRTLDGDAYDNTWSILFDHDQTGREHYGANRVIYVTPQTPPSVVIHEIGHLLEDQYPDVHRRAIEFLERRRYNDTERRLIDILPNSNYAPDEVVYEGRFFDPYVGKVYKYDNGYRASEVISMGLQRMYENPRGFAQDDPEYFDLILAVLRRAL